MAENKNTLVIAHGDLDGTISAVGVAKMMKISADQVKVVFTQPFLVDKVKIADDIEEIYVVDIAVNNRDVEMTRKFIKSIYDRLVCWYDHHQGWPAEIVNDGSAVFVTWEVAKSLSRTCFGRD